MISFDSKNKTFKLDTPNTSYVIGVVDFDQLVNLYYGDKIADTEGLGARSFRPRCASFSPLTSEYSTDAHDFSPDCAPMPASTHNRTYYRRKPASPPCMPRWNSIGRSCVRPKRS